MEQCSESLKWMFEINTDGGLFRIHVFVNVFKEDGAKKIEGYGAGHLAAATPCLRFRDQVLARFLIPRKCFF
jgi:hypothetical protein